ncbi:MAG: deoxynucleoside kinase [Defluviitaleaceae bacterium]|nr:deoxynucleoside kinase [Defluviitaleaceae bacterium]
MPNSGKSGAIKVAEKLMRRSKLEYKIIPEAAGYCKIKDKLSPMFNDWTFSQTLSLLTEAFNSNHNLVICERGIFDALCWARFHYDNGQLSQEEYDKSSSYFSLSRFSEKIALLITFRCNVETTISRENTHGIVGAEGTIINNKTLAILKTSIDETYRKYSHCFKQSIIIDSDELTQQEISSRFINEILIYLNDL